MYVCIYIYIYMICICTYIYKPSTNCLPGHQRNGLWHQLVHFGTRCTVCPSLPVAINP